MSKPFLIIQLRPEDEVANEELRALKEHGQLGDEEIVRLRAEIAGLPELALDDYAGIIVGGSPFDVSTDTARKSAIQLRIEDDFQQLLTEVAARDFPFLGCCSGNGLLGVYCGARISRRFAEPVGPAAITLTEQGQKDPLLAGLPERFTVLLGHKEACDSVPPEATLLATGEHCPVQMFRLKNNIYATQFHPEADAAGFTVRVHAYKHHGYFPPEHAEELINTVSSVPVPESNAILRRFVARYRA